MSPVRKFRYNKEFEVRSLKCHYYYKADHRDKSREKSQWILLPPDELRCFIHSQEEEWSEPNKSWGIWVNADKLEKLGENQNGDDLNVAFFLDSNKNKVWHGYPADFK